MSEQSGLTEPVRIGRINFGGERPAGGDSDRFNKISALHNFLVRGVFARLLKHLNLSRMFFPAIFSCHLVVVRYRASILKFFRTTIVVRCDVGWRCMFRCAAQVFGPALPNFFLIMRYEPTQLHDSISNTFPAGAACASLSLRHGDEIDSHDAPTPDVAPVDWRDVPEYALNPIIGNSRISTPILGALKCFDGV